MNRRRFLMISAAAIAAPGQSRAEVTSWQSDALGGRVRVDLRGPQALSGQLISAIAGVIEEVEAAASLFRPDSALCRLNVAGRLVNPPRALTDLLTLADHVHMQTGKVFDPTVQPLWRALAEGRGTAEARALIGWHSVRSSDPITLAPGQALTLNGIAQGYAADRVRTLLAAAGYTEALVDMGEFAALGGPFKIAIVDPDAGKVGTRTLTGTAIATSSPAAMRIGSAFHILGPDGRLPLWSTISVEADSAALADALSTAFCLMDASSIRAAMGRLSEVHRVLAVDFSGNLSTL